jgi:hypothetical protein
MDPLYYDSRDSGFFCERKHSVLGTSAVGSSDNKVFTPGNERVQNTEVPLLPESGWLYHLCADTSGDRVSRFSF